MLVSWYGATQTEVLSTYVTLEHAATTTLHTAVLGTYVALQYAAATMLQTEVLSTNANGGA